MNGSARPKLVLMSCVELGAVWLDGYVLDRNR